MIAPDDRVYWNRVSYGLFALPQKIPARVVRVSGDSAKIKVAKLSGKIVLRSVSLADLTARTKPSQDLGESDV